MKNKIIIGVVFYGDLNQNGVNSQQYKFLKKELRDFVLKKYDFHKTTEWGRLLNEYESGKLNVVLKNSYGRGHEADIERWLDKHNIPYVGSGPKATLDGTDKFISKKIFCSHKLPIIEDVFVNLTSWVCHRKVILKKISKNICFPCILKDVAGTDSRGLFILNNENATKNTLDKELKEGRRFIVEKFLEDKYEVTCFVGGRKKLTAFEPAGLGGRSFFFSGKAKDKMQFKLDLPAKLPKTLITKVKNFSIIAHKALGCRDFSRTDFLVKDNKIYLLETDVHPGFRQKSVSTLSIRLSGVSINDFFKGLLEKQHNNKR